VARGLSVMNFLTALCGIAAFGAIGTNLVLAGAISRHGLTHPDPATGQTAAYNLHGTFIYTTARLMFWMHLSSNVGRVAVVATVLLLVLSGKTLKRRA